MHYSHTLYIDRAPVAEIEILVEPFLTGSNQLALELSVTDVDGQEHGIQCPELLSIILAKHWRIARSPKQRRPQAAFIISGDPS